MSKLRRRNFIKNSIAAGIGTSLFNVDSSTAKDKWDKSVSKGTVAPKKVIVGGAGIAGLSCAYELMKMGHEVTVLEASGRHGGHVLTAHDGLSDGLYGDYGQEHFTKPGYDKYWEYVKEFNLTALPYPRRKNLVRRINGVFYTEEMLKDPAILRRFGFNADEVKYLSDNPWTELRRMFIHPYLDKFKDEYQPFGIGYDQLDSVPMADIYVKEGASKTAQDFLGGRHSSALFGLWMAAILKIRGVPSSPTDIYRLKGGNQLLTDAFAKKLGPKLWLNCQIKAITNSDKGVSISYSQQSQVSEISADYFVNCIPLPAFKNIPVKPTLPAGKQYVIDNVHYGTEQRFVFQASSKFWEKDGLNINMDLDHPDLTEVWHSSEEVDTHRVILLGGGPGGISPQRALAAFREVYPGKDTIEQVISKDWSKDAFSPYCERRSFPIGELSRFWPTIHKPHGRIHFAGAYADNLSWGAEAAVRSANRVAKEINLT